MKAKEYAAMMDICRDTDEEVVEDVRSTMSKFYKEFADSITIPKGKVSHIVRSHTTAKVNSKIMEFHKKWVAVCGLTKQVDLKHDGFLNMIKLYSEFIYGEFIRIYPDLVSK